jgi:hypothetical protein
LSSAVRRHRQNVHLSSVAAGGSAAATVDHVSKLSGEEFRLNSWVVKMLVRYSWTRVSSSRARY